MITIAFILVAYCLRKRYLPEDAPVMMKVFYYGSFVVLTPLLAIPLYMWIKSSRYDGPTSGNDSNFVGNYPGFM